MSKEGKERNFKIAKWVIVNDYSPEKSQYIVLSSEKHFLVLKKNLYLY